MSDTTVGPPAPGPTGYQPSAAPDRLRHRRASSRRPGCRRRRPAYVPPPRPRRTGLVLFWPTLALIAIALGTLGHLRRQRARSTPRRTSPWRSPSPRVMLLIGAFVGRPGGLIALGLVASLGLGITSAVEASTDWQTGGETLNATPITLDRRAGRLHASRTARCTLDLSRRARRRPRSTGAQIDVHLNAGEIDVTLPPRRQRRGRRRHALRRRHQHRRVRPRAGSTSR